MARPRVALLFFLVALTPALAGCSFQDFYNQRGTVTITLSPLRDAPNSSMNEFQRVTIAVYGVTIRQFQSIDPKSFSFPAGQPLLVDMVDKADTRIPLASFKTNLRATSQVIVRADVVEAITAAGTSLKICREGIEIKNADYPCFFVPASLAWVYDRRGFAPPRGGEVVVVYPMVIKYVQDDRGRGEYYIDDPPELVEFENNR